MSYATNTDITAEFPAFSGFTTSTKVTATQVDEFCTRASNLIDAKIGGKYSTPIVLATSPKSFSLLKEICCWLVYARIAPIVGIATGDQKSSPGNKKAPDYEKKAMDLLKEIQSGSAKLVDATLATSADGVESFTNDNIADLGDPTFTREGDDW